MLKSAIYEQTGLFSLAKPTCLDEGKSLNSKQVLYIVSIYVFNFFVVESLRVLSCLGFMAY